MCLIINKAYPAYEMDLKDHIWNIAAKKLADEATETELMELNTLLQEHPDQEAILKLIFDWWQTNSRQEDNKRSNLLFEKVLKCIKVNESGKKDTLF